MPVSAVVYSGPSARRGHLAHQTGPMRRLVPRSQTSTPGVEISDSFRLNIA